MEPTVSSGETSYHSRESSGGSVECSICHRRLKGTVRYVEETGDVPGPRQSWTFCAACDEAVRNEVESSPVRTAVRLRVAVGVVAAVRTPMARRLRWGASLTDEQWLRILMWGFIVGFIVHTLVMILIARMVFAS